MCERLRDQPYVLEVDFSVAWELSVFVRDGVLHYGLWLLRDIVQILSLNRQTWIYQDIQEFH